MRAALAICLLLVVGCTANGPAVAHRSPALSPSVSSAPTSRPTPSPGNLTSGGVIEYAVPNPSPTGSGCVGCGQAALSGITAGRDGNIWFFDVGQNFVGRVTPAGVITQFAVPAGGSGSRSIVGAPDGNVWMVGRIQAKDQPDLILKISPAGVVTQFPIGVSVGPESIAWGPDGNIWFTEFWTGRIGRMTPAGTITEFQAGSSLRGIVTGPDHNLWFVQDNFNYTAIGRMTTSGAVTLFPLGGSADQQLQPSEIIAGPDGNLWFTQIGSVGRITVAGVVTRFGISNNGPTGIAVGPDGNVWFTNAQRNTVGRISPTGDVRQFPLPRQNSGPVSIAAGSDGRMWFTEAGRSKIASIGMTVPQASFSRRVLNFGSPATSAEWSEIVTNNGDGPLRMESATLTGLDRELFNIASDTCSGKVLAINAQCNVDVIFKPGAVGGLVAGQLRFVDNATGSPHLISLVAGLPDCRLPLSADSPTRGQLLSLATGQVADDPKGGFLVDSLGSSSQAEPVLHGQTWISYNRAAGRWVPADVSAVLSDGSRYAYVDYHDIAHFQLHVVDIATGRDRTLPIDKGYWGVVGFTSAGIFMHQSYEGVGPGLWLVNPDSGAMRTIFSDTAVAFVSGQVAWTYAWNDADKLRHPPGMGGGFNEVRSRDLNTSKTTTWMYRAGTDVYVMAVAERGIVVRGNDPNTSFLWVVSGPGQAQSVIALGTGDAEPFTGRAIADANGWWLGGLDGVYLWTPRTGAVLISEVTASPAGTCA